jgi:serine/threonine protein kinase
MPEVYQILSHYRIIEKLGQGGMGEVFLAHDTSLDRKVALKFLPDIFSGDPERLAPFAVGTDNAQILICGVEMGQPTRLIQGGINYSRVWASDGKRIAFTCYRQGYTWRHKLLRIR